MTKSNTACADGIVHKSEMENQVTAVEEKQPCGSANNVEGHMNHRDPLGPSGDADGGNQGGDAGADILTHNDWNGHTVAEGAGQSQGLQDTHGGGGGLDYRRKDRAHQHAQDGIIESRQQIGEARQIGKRTDSVLHHIHAGHQNCEADQDTAHIPAPLSFRGHDQQDAHQREQRRKVFRLHKIQEETLAFNARQRQNPGRQGRAHIGPHNYPDGLSQIHHAGVHHAHQHHRHSGGRLDRNGNPRAQQQALDGIGGHFFQQALQTAASHFLQALGHGGHAIEEKSQAAAEGKQGKDIHTATPHFRVRPKFIGQFILCGISIIYVFSQFWKRAI